MDYTLADLTKAISMVKNIEKKEEYIISFTKEDDGLWKKHGVGSGDHFKIIDYLCKRNMTKEELQKIIAIDEGFRIELTTSKGDMDKF